MFLNIKKMTVAYAAVIFFVGLDRLFKAFAVTGYKFNFVKNYYIAFSLPLAGWRLNAVISLIIFLLIYYLAKSWRQGGQILTSLCLFAIVLGAASNLFDRLKYGYVIDYLDLKYFTVFNLADVMIVAGLVFLLAVAYKKEAK